MARDVAGSGKQQHSLAAVVAGTGGAKHAFSFKDAVVRAPPKVPLVARSAHLSIDANEKHSDQRSSKRPGNARSSKIIRSKSVSHIVESPTFKKRCEALKSHACAKHGAKKLEGAASPKKGSSNDSDGKPTALQELYEREKLLKSSGKKKSSKSSKHARDRASPRKALLTASKSLPASNMSGQEVAKPRERSASADGASVSDAPVQSRKRASSAPESSLLSISTPELQLDSSADREEQRVDCRSIVTSPPPHKSLDTDDELDCDDTNSESTAESSCPSPRHSSLSGFHCHHRDLRVCSPSKIDEHDELSETLSHDTDEDDEALMLLDRINALSAEFAAQREHEEASALCWSVQHAGQHGIISTHMQQNLIANIRHGFLDEARDVLYHKCHLSPAVGSVIESPETPKIDPDVAQSFLSFVDEISPADATVERLHKLHVLKLLSDLLTKWVKMVGYERGLSEEHIALTSGSLFLAGSYRLGLDDPNSDIDAVCVAPWHVTRDDFFGSFCRMLQDSDQVSHLAPVPNAYVPLIALTFLGVRMDLLFARLPLPAVESHQEIDSDHMLVGVHSESMKSLNAPRVSSMLLCLVPKRREFRIVLRAVRAWARRRGIYSAKLGYLGGISWAILVAFVCQLYPNAEPAKIFVRFFQVLSEWQWPQPIMLNMHYDAGLGFEMWDPRLNIHDRAHIMPIITPAYPHMNSSVQVSHSTFSVIYEELWRARYLAEIAVGISRPLPPAGLGVSTDSEGDMRAKIVCTATSIPVLECDAAVQDALASDPHSSWVKMFEPSNFFIRYGSYLVVDFEAASEAAMYKWSKFVQSRVRKLVDSLQHVSPVARVHAFPSFFPHTSDRKSAFGSCVFIGIEFHSRRNNGGSQLPPQDDPEVKNTLEQTIRFFLATDLQQMEDRQPDMEARMTFLSWTELPDFVFPFARSNAEAERVAYQDELEKIGFARNTSPSFRPPFMPGFHRGSRWRGNGPRKYAGGQRKVFRRDGARPYAGTQAG